MSTATALSAHGAHVGNHVFEDVGNTGAIHKRTDSMMEESDGVLNQHETTASESNTSTKAHSSTTQNVPPSDILDYDMLIIGAGISGVNMAYRYQESFPNGTYIVLEQRENMGGTWDLMKYPGIRSDSDLYTFGFAWRPWPEKIPIAEGGAILKYMKESAVQYGIDRKILYQHKVKESKWSSREQVWTLTVEAINGATGKKRIRYFRGKFMVLGTGYYNYDKPLEAKINGIENFQGRVVHPQFWDTKLDWTDKRVAVIGSGATTITLIPALAKTAKKVTMVQRSPSYIISQSNRHIVKWWHWFIPAIIQSRLTRLLYLFQGFFLRRMIKNSEKLKEWLTKATKELLPSHISYETHFKPRYAPGTQRICLCPDGDFFAALREGKADVATGIIKTVTENSIVLESGQTIEADIIITATGLHLAYGGNATFTVDAEPLDWSKKFLWRGAMIQDAPNIMLVQGYSTASWTLGADATAHLTCRLLKHMQKHKQTSAVPRVTDELQIEKSAAPGIMGLTSTYIVRAKERLPMHGERDPWRPRGDYIRDLWFAKFGDLRKGLSFVGKVGE